MVRSLWTAAAGMNSQQFNIDTISNNLSNVNTTGFKKNRAEFEDLLYQTLKVAGTPATEDTLLPVGVQVGHGSQVSSTQKVHTQGSLQNTGVISDVAVQGEGMFQVLLYDGSYGYTRDGSFKIDSNGQFVTSDGYRLQPDLAMPEGYVQDSVAISQSGKVTVRLPGRDDPIQVGQLELYRFVNPSGLSAIGQNLYKQTPASGEAIGNQPGQAGMGQTIHKFLEMSNVQVVQEMVNLIVAQRAYEFNSKAVQTSDTMLGIAANLKR